MTLALSTAGPLRIGYVVFSGSGGSGGTQDSSSEGWTLNLQRGSKSTSGDIVDGCAGWMRDCRNGPITDQQWPFDIAPVEITLGTNLVLTETAWATASTFPSYLPVGGSAGETLSMQFFETDGTPVQILDPTATATPEPATWVLIALPLALLFCRYRRRIRRAEFRREAASDLPD